jgi:hypothetical protein
MKNWQIYFTWLNSNLLLHSCFNKRLLKFVILLVYAKDGININVINIRKAVVINTGIFTLTSLKFNLEVFNDASSYTNSFKWLIYLLVAQ